MTESKRVGGEYGAIRASIDVPKLEVYLAKAVPSVRSPLDVKQFKFGQSNPTYFLTDANGKRYVLRKKPAGQLLSKTAHQVEREYTILRALHTHNTSPSTSPDRRIPVPEPYVLCEDNSVIGTPFYVMQYLDGRIFTDARMPGMSPKDQRECWLSAVRALAALASVTPSSIGLSKFGPSSDYFPRQIKSMSRVSDAQATAVDVDTKEPVGKIPMYDEMISWYSNNLPDEKKLLGSRIVHGDYKLDNLIFHPTENRVIGILDWELCTLGSPLADFANLTQPWTVHRKWILQGSNLIAFRGSPPEEAPPISVEELEQEYCRLVHLPYPIKELVFVRSWMLFRLAIIAQGIAARAARRQASSENASLYATQFRLIGTIARLLLEEEGILIKKDSLQGKL